jgi:hypothetical protein
MNHYGNQTYEMSEPSRVCNLKCESNKGNENYPQRIFKSAHSGLNMYNYNKSRAKKSNSESSFKFLNACTSNSAIRTNGSSISSLNKKKGKIFSFEDIRFRINDDQLKEFRNHMLGLFEVRL